MVEETKQIRTLILGSITCDRSLCDCAFSDIHEAMNHVLGHPIWTHELSYFADQAKEQIIAQFPDMPTEPPDDWRVCALDLIARYGETVPVRRGNLERQSGPLETLREIKPDAEVIIVSTGGDTDG